MKIEEYIEILQSEDTQKVWSASWEIIKLRDFSSLGPLTKAMPRINKAVATLPDDARPSIRDYRDVPRLAAYILECVASDKCRCTVYSNSNCLDPEDEQSMGRVKIDDAKEDEKLWSVRYFCSCNQCSNTFSVKRDDGYHFPIWTWERL